MLQNVKNGSLGAWYVMHDLNPGRYRVGEQYGPNASSFAQSLVDLTVAERLLGAIRGAR